MSRGSLNRRRTSRRHSAGRSDHWGCCSSSGCKSRGLIQVGPSSFVFSRLCFFKALLFKALFFKASFDKPRCARANLHRTHPHTHARTHARTRSGHTLTHWTGNLSQFLNANYKRADRNMPSPTYCNHSLLCYQRQYPIICILLRQLYGFFSYNGYQSLVRISRIYFRSTHFSSKYSKVIQKSSLLLSLSLSLSLSLCVTSSIS
jgi:hypothetical protein